MKSVVLTIPSFAFIVATRAALGVGVGLLASIACLRTGGGASARARGARRGDNGARGDADHARRRRFSSGARPDAIAPSSARRTSRAKATRRLTAWVAN